jgi:hypothetical protein
MRRLVLAASVALISGWAVRAETPEDAYFAARAAASAKVKAAVDANKPEEAVNRLEDEGRTALLGQLSALVGSRKPKGYEKGELSLDSLQPDAEGADQLDAVIYTKGDNDPSVSVTPEGVADHWLAALRADPDRKDMKIPATLEEALTAPDFYTLAVGGDAAFSLYTPVPIKDASAVALLGAFQQESGPNPPGALVVSVRRGGLLYLIQAQPAKELKTPPACDAVWKSYDQKRDKAQQAYDASHEKDEAQLDAAQKAEAEGDEAFRSCFAREIKPEDMAALRRQAEEMEKLVP